MFIVKIALVIGVLFGALSVHAESHHKPDAYHPADRLTLVHQFYYGKQPVEELEPNGYILDGIKAARLMHRQNLRPATVPELVAFADHSRPNPANDCVMTMDALWVTSFCNKDGIWVRRTYSKEMEFEVQDHLLGTPIQKQR